MLNQQYRALLYSLILLLSPSTSYADVKIYFGVPGFTHYRHNYYPHNNYHRPNKAYTINNNVYSNHRFNDLSSLQQQHGNKHEYDRAMYYQNKYSSSYNNAKPHFQNSYRKGFQHGRHFERQNRNRRLGQ